MIYITGDTHAYFDRVEEFCEIYETEKSDVLIILGDAAINYHCDDIDISTKEQLSELPITLLCIHGNHEKRPENIKTYEETYRFGGDVYWEPEYPNLLFAKDGEIYKLAGKRCIAIGGAYSVDKAVRTPGVDWWPDEQPSEEIKARVEARLEEENWNVDVVLSHTCPYKYIPKEMFLPGIDSSFVDKSTEKWLDDIEDKLSYSLWYCGHFHTDKWVNNLVFLSDEILEFYELE